MCIPQYQNKRLPWYPRLPLKNNICSNFSDDGFSRLEQWPFSYKQIIKELTTDDGVSDGKVWVIVLTVLVSKDGKVNLLQKLGTTII